MPPFKRVGLLVNPHAGHGPDGNLRAARQAVEALGAQSIVTGPGELGANALAGWPGGLEVCEAGQGPGRPQTLALAQAIAVRQPEAIIVVGGDGTLADAAFANLDSPDAPPLLGIGAGAMNAGPLVACRAEHAGELRPERLQIEAVDGVLAYSNGELLGLGLNDALIAFTLVGMLNGERADLDAAEKAQGRSVASAPCPIGGPHTRVLRTGRGEPALVAQGEEVGAVIVGLAEGAFFGKAVAGGVCLAALTGLPAGCLVCDRPLNRVGVTAESLLDWPPILSRFVTLDETSQIVVEGVQAGATVIADGNPLRQLGSGDRATFAVRRKAVQAWRPIA